jgi:MFS family permease
LNSKVKPTVLLNIFHVLIDGLFESVPLLLSFMAIAWGSGEKEVGLIISLAVMASTVAGLATKPLSRRFGRLTALTGITALYGAGFFMNAFAANLYFAGGCFILATAGHTVFHSISFSYLSTATDRAGLGTVLGNFTALGDIGRVPFTALAGFVAASSLFGFPGWRIVSFIYGLGALSFSYWAGVFLFSQNDRTPIEESAATKATKNLPDLSLLRNSRYVLPIITNSFDAFGSDRIFTFLPFLLLAKHIEPQQIGLFALLFMLSGLAGKMVCGRLVDRFGARPVFIAAESSMALLLGVLVVASQPSLLLVTAFLLGMVTKGTVPVVQTIVANAVETPAEYEDIFTLNSLARGVTNILAPLVFGFIAAAYGVIWAYGVMGIAACCAVLPIALLRKTGR